MPDDPAQAGTDDPPRGERRWPMAVSVVVSISLLVALPNEVRPGPRWLVSLIGLFLLALIVADPGRIDRRSRTERVLSIALLGLLIASAMGATWLLVHRLVVGGQLTKSATGLLLVGSAVFIMNNIVFGLLYWEGDSGGSAARTLHPDAHPDLAFPQQLTPDIAPATWRPLFIDYLYLSLTNSLAFSPTDVMPLVPWAKISMAFQSLISLAIIALVIARAVNILK